MKNFLILLELEISINGGEYYRTIYDVLYEVIYASSEEEVKKVLKIKQGDFHEADSRITHISIKEI